MHISKKQLAQGLLHVIPWLVLLFVSVNSLGGRGQADPNFVTRGLISMTLMVGAFYLNYSILIPRFLFKRKIRNYVFATIFGLLGVVVLTVLINHLTFPPEFMHGGKKIEVTAQFWLRQSVFVFFRTLMLFAIGLAARMTSRWLSEEKSMQEIKEEQLKTELSLLKNQLNPHFFFNTLNSIYSLTETEPKKAQEVTHKLSKLMRYFLYETEKTPTVTLGREVKFLNTYLDLMRVRINQKVIIESDFCPETDSAKLPALLFIPFVENAFKHGLSLVEECVIKFSLSRKDNQVLFTSSNPIPKVVDSLKEEGGLGLVNINRRLVLLFGKKNYELQINNDGQIYSVKLTLNLDED
ncbi:MAG: two-component system LytT family sensor kinase [Sphingobacteriales bacterium]|jgi:two-component system LytT family sensor kinase